MELFLSFAPSDTTRNVLLRAAKEAGKHARGTIHRYETLHSTLAYLGEVDEEKLPELRTIISKVSDRHNKLHVVGDRVVVSQDTSIYGAWGLLYVWKKTREVQLLFEDMVDELTKAGYLKNYNRDFLLHSTLYMQYFPDKGFENNAPDTPPVEDCFDRIILYQVTEIDGHVAYYPLFETRLK